MELGGINPQPVPKMHDLVSPVWKPKDDALEQPLYMRGSTQRTIDCVRHHVELSAHRGVQLRRAGRVSSFLSPS